MKVNNKSKITREDKTQEVFLSRIKNNFGNHLQKIILFGSRARKDYSAESDYDFLFIFDEVNRKRRDFIEDLASEMLLNEGKLFSTFIFSQEQFNQMRFEPFIINSLKEGVLL